MQENGNTLRGNATAGDYQDFLQQKKIVAPSTGFEVEREQANRVLFDFQRDLLIWALRKGRAAIFADTGLGKTLIQAEAARLINEYTATPVLIAAPLSVARQTVRLAAEMLGIEITYVRSPAEVTPGINITNYEMIGHFDAAAFGAILLDESSILKGLDGKTRQRLTEMFASTPFRLCFTATPAPNDITEIANHAEFLGIMTVNEMQGAFFVHDTEWRLRRHGEKAFYRWLASWGMSIRRPSDLGYDDTGYDLPPLTVTPRFLEVEYQPTDALFFTKLKGVADRADVRKKTLHTKVEAAAAHINASEGQWIVWHGLNPEGEALAKLIPDAVLVEGSQTPEYKAQAMEDFQAGKYRVLISKAKIAGFGMNFQNCHQMAFVGMSDSWEAYYQCIRRCYRFGQTEPVQVDVWLTELEQDIFENVMRKEREANRMSEALIENVRQFEQAEIEKMQADWEYQTDEVVGDGYRLLLGDSTERIKELDDNSVDLSVFSPPFASLYTYSNSERDLGNSKNEDEFFEHFKFIIKDLLRVTKPGRIACCHVTDIPAMLVRDGYIGLKDFSGEVIRAFIEAGWIFDARVPIDKNQQAQSIRTHAKGLTMTQMEKDRTWSRPAMPDYILKFRKPGENKTPVAGGDISRDLWIEWANPTWSSEIDRCADAGGMATWYGISESDTLQGWQQARAAEDERHICPLQLGTIERCIRLWSNEGETVFTPFLGIGSEAVTAIRFGREAIGIELKPSYFKMAVKNCERVLEERKPSEQMSLMDVTA